MNKLDNITKITNIALAIIYVPFAIFCFLLQMASESTIDATNPVYISLIETFCLIALFIPAFCIIGIVLSVILRTKGYSVWAFIVQFLPIGMFALNMLILLVASGMPR